MHTRSKNGTYLFIHLFLVRGSSGFLPSLHCCNLSSHLVECYECSTWGLTSSILHVEQILKQKDINNKNVTYQMAII